MVLCLACGLSKEGEEEREMIEMKKKTAGRSFLVSSRISEESLRRRNENSLEKIFLHSLSLSPTNQTRRRQSDRFAHHGNYTKSEVTREKQRQRKKK